MLKLISKDEYPMELLLQADPDLKILASYLEESCVYKYEEFGVVVVKQLDDTKCEIMAIAVKEAYRNKGIGRSILNAIIEMYSKTFTEIIIRTGNSSIGQLHLYKSCGFKAISKDIDFFIHQYPEAIFENGVQCRDRITLSLTL